MTQDVSWKHQKDQPCALSWSFESCDNSLTTKKLKGLETEFSHVHNDLINHTQVMKPQ